MRAAMLGTSRTVSRFYCPACGTGLRAPQADAGHAIECDGCGIAVRVPRYPHPLESDADDGPLVTPSAAISARSGLELLSRSLTYFTLGLGVSLIAMAVWVKLEGPAAVPNRTLGRAADVVLAAAVLEIGFAWAGAALRWVGYARCRPAADAVRAGGWVAVAQLGAAGVVFGHTLAVVPVFAVAFGEVSPVFLNAAFQIGLLFRGIGAAAEFGILFVWVRLVLESDGAGAARRVSQYAAAVLAGILGTAASVGLAGFAVVLALRKHGPTERLDFAAIPWDGWYTVGGAVVVAIGFAVALTVQYRRLLHTVRASVGGPIAVR
ncbi:MAG: hypothetical protein ACRC7O_06895 [Fimbriiglobus sp.]